jgi:hypothetical protein
MNALHDLIARIGDTRWPVLNRPAPLDAHLDEAH